MPEPEQQFDKETMAHLVVVQRNTLEFMENFEDVSPSSPVEIARIKPDDTPHLDDAVIQSLSSAGLRKRRDWKDCKPVEQHEEFEIRNVFRFKMADGDYAIIQRMVLFKERISDDPTEIRRVSDVVYSGIRTTYDDIVQVFTTEATQEQLDNGGDVALHPEEEAIRGLDNLDLLESKRAEEVATLDNGDWSLGYKIIGPYIGKNGREFTEVHFPSVDGVSVMYYTDQEMSVYRQDS